MLPDPPKLDTRTYNDLVDQVETLVESTTDWQRATPGKELDFGGAIIRIFSRMMERTITRLNRVPEKNFLAFLDLIGTQIQPPKAARVPLTFELARGRALPVIVPAGTRSAAAFKFGEQKEVLFETEKDLVVTPIKISTLLVGVPGSNQVRDLSQIAHLNNALGVKVFDDSLNFNVGASATTKPIPTQCLYVGFDRSLGNQPIFLFVVIEPPDYREATGEKNDARIAWEYKTDKGWRPLSLADETKSFSEQGLLTFIPPSNLIESEEFGQTHHWIRASWTGGRFQVMPRLRGLLTNTTWATQSVGIANEVLGSSNGEPSQTFQIAQTPVLSGQQLLVLEREVPTGPEADAIIQALGKEAIQPVVTLSGETRGAWVQWQAVPDFYGSAAGDRHYVLNALTGQIQFSDDRAGRIPPQGRNNIRISYRTGGGHRGNRPAGNVVQLKSAVPYVKGVTNLEPSTSGANAESLDTVKQRGPRQLRHRFRAATVQDYADLAYEASSEVARAKAIPPTFDLFRQDWVDPTDPDASTLPVISDDAVDDVVPPGQMEILIVPLNQTPQPTPSLGLINHVKAYLQDRCDATVTLKVRGPTWQAVTIRVEVVPVSLQAAIGLDATVIQRLNEFLHPLTGGAEGLGWAFGRLPYKSDIYAVLESISGVDHTRSLDIIFTDDQGEVLDSAPQASERLLVYSGPHEVTLNFEEVNR